ncbi:DNA-binding transcriptional regulator, AcrR family [Lentibacillus persicus]|uniref:DNA-binding transcriptional regulator, AcrR family n=1 Tax=Lentibacillus persicus TaxID=640948 RepID=A0A1I1W9U2_9BACI|nr:TetR/AcrR family transcriptional regulator [Lentibacillus persicus]SFD90153.1 DNA-binding transcriptional regulator, AcrR family [Lentibacillus persicus]
MDSRKRLPAKQRRRILIHAAIDVFSESNFQVAKVADIASRAGISEPMVYKFFNSKKELFLEILDSTSHKTLQNFLAFNREGFEQAASKEELIRLLEESLMTYFDSMETYRKEIKIYFQAISEIDDPDVQEVLKSAYERYADFYDSVLQRAQAKNLIGSALDTKAIAWDIVGFTIHQSTLFIMGYYDKENLKAFLSRRLQTWL